MVIICLIRKTGNLVQFWVGPLTLKSLTNNNLIMFWDNREEEEAFKVRPKVEEKNQVISNQPDMEEVVGKINTITEQINLMSKYLSYLSQKFDKTIDSAITYDNTLDNIENRINTLKNKIESLEIVSPDVDLAEDRNRAI